MENLALQLINDVIERAEETTGFQVDSDEKAEWCLRKIREEKAELRRMQILCENMIFYYQESLKTASDKFDRETAFFNGQLAQYFNKLKEEGKVKATKTQETYSLPSGTLKLKYQQPEFIRDEAALLKYCHDNDLIYGDYIKVKESVDWAGMKKLLTFENGKVITDDGEILEAVQVVEREPKFEIEI